MSRFDENDPAALLAALAWQVEMGADEAILPEPQDRRGVAPAQQPAPATAEGGKKPPLPGRFGQQQAERMAVDPPPQQAAAIAASSEVALSARQLAAGANSLAELEAALQGFDDCPLKKTAKSLVFADGNPEARIMLVGEAPGRDEDLQGKPFVGASGQLLDKMLAAIGLDRSSVYIGNCVQWRPPGNRKPTDGEKAMCLPFIRRQIELVNPAILVLVGGTSAQSLLEETQGITRLRGRWHDYQISESGGTNVPAMPIFHPAFLLRTPARKRETWTDLLNIKDKMVALGLID